MVLRLGDTLGVGLRGPTNCCTLPDCQRPTRRKPPSPNLAPYRAAIERLLKAHEPYPAMVLDARFTVVFANQACAALFGPQVVGSNFVRDVLADPATAETIVNWPEVAWAGLDRLRQDVTRSPFDEELHSLIAMAEAALDGISRPPTAGAGLIVCPWFRVGGKVVRTIAMVASSRHIAEVTLDQLRVELMSP